MIWTQEEIEELEVYVNKGFTHKEIGDIFDRTESSVKSKCYKLKLSNNREGSIRISKSESIAINKNYSSKQKKCGFGIKMTKDSYQKRLIDIGSSVRIIGKYINAKTSAEHVCLVCGKHHHAIPSNKLRGAGHCGRGSGVGRMNTQKSCIVYFIYLIEYDLYKIGVTTVNLDTRVNTMGIKQKNYDRILIRRFSTVHEALELEQSWLKNIGKYKVNTGLLKNGNTETFRYTTE